MSISKIKDSSGVEHDIAVKFNNVLDMPTIPTTYLKKVATIKGHTFKWNQLIDTSYSSAQVSFVNGYLTITNINGGNNYRICSNYRNFYKNHKYLVNLNNIDKDASLDSINNYFLVDDVVTTITSSSIINSTKDHYGRIGFVFGSNTVANSYYKAYINVVDLTDIGLDSLTTVDQVKAEILKRYNINLDTYQPYDTGSLKNVNVEKIESYTANLYDIDTIGYENNVALGSSGGTYADNLRWTTNYIPVKANKTYYFNSYEWYNFYNSAKGFVIQNSASSYTPTQDGFLRVTCLKSNNYKFTLSLAQVSGYIPYKKLGSLTLPNIDLRGVNDIQDTLEFVEQEDGTYNLEHTKYIDRVDLGTLDWHYSSGSSRFYVFISSLGAKPIAASEIGNLLCSKLMTTSWGRVYQNLDNFSIAIRDNGLEFNVYYSTITNVDIFKQAMSGVLLDYELVTPVKTVIATGLLFDEVSLLINKYGRIEVVNRSTDNVNADIEYLDIDTINPVILNGKSADYYLDYNNFVNTPALSQYTPVLTNITYGDDGIITVPSTAKKIKVTFIMTWSVDGDGARETKLYYHLSNGGTSYIDLETTSSTCPRVMRYTTRKEFEITKVSSTKYYIKITDHDNEDSTIAINDYYLTVSNGVYINQFLVDANFDDNTYEDDLMNYFYEIYE